MSFSIVHLRRDAERLGHVFVKGNCACHACDLELAAASVTPCHVPVLAALRAVWAALENSSSLTAEQFFKLREQYRAAIAKTEQS